MGRSLGGSVVDRSLEAAGFDPTWEGCAIVETALPRREPFTSVLVQSAWNVIPWREFLVLSQPYSWAVRARMTARRVVTQINLRRAERIVTLSDDIARLTERSVGRAVLRAPVHAPMDAPQTPAPAVASPEPAEGQQEIVVVGTITWYKRPEWAIDLAVALREAGLTPSVHFLGHDDGSGCWEQVQARAAAEEIPVRQGLIGRDELFATMSRAWAVAVPSRLESLSFALLEALLLARRVYASPISVHREMAEAIGRTPVWLPEATVVDATAPARLNPTTVMSQWEAVGEALGLPTLHSHWTD